LGCYGKRRFGSGGEKTGAICRGLDISEQNYYRWRREYGGLKVTQAARLKSLEKENARLREAVSNLTRDALILNQRVLGSSPSASTIFPLFYKHLKSSPALWAAHL